MWFHFREHQFRHILLTDRQKNAHLFQHQGHTNKMDSEYLENYVWIYAHASNLDEGVVL